MSLISDIQKAYESLDSAAMLILGRPATITYKSVKDLDPSLYYFIEGRFKDTTKDRIVTVVRSSTGELISLSRHETTGLLKGSYAQVKGGKLVGPETPPKTAEQKIESGGGFVTPTGKLKPAVKKPWTAEYHDKYDRYQKDINYNFYINTRIVNQLEDLPEGPEFYADYIGVSEGNIDANEYLFGYVTEGILGGLGYQTFFAIPISNVHDVGPGDKFEIRNGKVRLLNYETEYVPAGTWNLGEDEEEPKGAKLAQSRVQGLVFYGDEKNENKYIPAPEELEQGRLIDIDPDNPIYDPDPRLIDPRKYLNSGGKSSLASRSWPGPVNEYNPRGYPLMEYRLGGGPGQSQTYREDDPTKLKQDAEFTFQGMYYDPQARDTFGVFTTNVAGIPRFWSVPESKLPTSLSTHPAGTPFQGSDLVPDPDDKFVRAPVPDISPDLPVGTAEPDYNGWFWVTGDRACSECARRNGIFFPMTREFEPLHPNCKCAPQYAYVPDPKYGSESKYPIHLPKKSEPKSNAHEKVKEKPEPVPESGPGPDHKPWKSKPDSGKLRHEGNLWVRYDGDNKDNTSRIYTADGYFVGAFFHGLIPDDAQPHSWLEYNPRDNEFYLPQTKETYLKRQEEREAKARAQAREEAKNRPKEEEEDEEVYTGPKAPDKPTPKTMPQLKGRQMWVQTIRNGDMIELWDNRHNRVSMIPYYKFPNGNETRTGEFLVFDPGTGQGNESVYEIPIEAQEEYQLAEEQYEKDQADWESLFKEYISKGFCTLTSKTGARYVVNAPGLDCKGSGKDSKDRTKDKVTLTPPDRTPVPGTAIHTPDDPVFDMMPVTLSDGTKVSLIIPGPDKSGQAKLIDAPEMVSTGLDIALLHGLGQGLIRAIPMTQDIFKVVIQSSVKELGDLLERYGKELPEWVSQKSPLEFHPNPDRAIYIPIEVPKGDTRKLFVMLPAETEKPLLNGKAMAYEDVPPQVWVFDGTDYAASKEGLSAMNRFERWPSTKEFQEARLKESSSKWIDWTESLSADAVLLQGYINEHKRLNPELYDNNGKPKSEHSIGQVSAASSENHTNTSIMVDRIEDGQAVILNNMGDVLGNIPVSVLPNGTKEGDWLDLAKQGFAINSTLTEDNRAKILDLISNLQGQAQGQNWGGDTLRSLLDTAAENIGTPGDSEYLKTKGPAPSQSGSGTVQNIVDGVATIETEDGEEYTADAQGLAVGQHVAWNLLARKFEPRGRSRIEQLLGGDSSSLQSTAEGIAQNLGNVVKITEVRNGMATLEGRGGDQVDIDVSELPADAKTGDQLLITDGGKIYIDRPADIEKGFCTIDTKDGDRRVVFIPGYCEHKSGGSKGKSKKSGSSSASSASKPAWMASAASYSIDPAFPADVQLFDAGGQYIGRLSQYRQHLPLLEGLVQKELVIKMQISDMIPSNLKNVTDQEILQAWHRLNQLYALWQKQGRATGDLVNAGRFVLEEFERRGFNHSVNNLASAISRLEVPGSIKKALDEMPDEVVLVSDFVSLVGSAVTKSHSADVDVLFRASRDDSGRNYLIQSDNVLLPVRNALNLAKDIHGIDNPQGPHGNFVPIYSLVLRKEEPAIHIIKESSGPLARFSPEKPLMLGYTDFFSIPDELWPWCQKKIARGATLAGEVKFDGFRCTIAKDGSKIEIWFEDSGQDRASRLPALVELAKMSSHPSFVLDGELLAIRNGKVVPRTQLMEMLGDNPNDLTPLYMAFDVLWMDGEDLKDRLLDARQRILKAMLEGDLKSPLVGLSKPVRFHTEKELEIAWRWASSQPGSEGIVVKDLNKPYDEGGSDDWSKVKTTVELKVKVLSVEKVSNGYTYDCALEDQASDNGLYHMGKTFVTPSKIADQGDTINVRIEELLVLQEDDGKKRYAWGKPTVVGPDSSRDAYTVSQAVDLARRGHVLKEEVKKSFVPGIGPANAPIAFIAASPSELESIRRTPLVGQAGYVFKEHYLNPLGLGRDQVIIAHVVPEVLKSDGRIRGPTQAEIDHYLPSLIKALDDSRPGLVVALGRVAKEALGDRAALVLPHPLALVSKGDRGEVSRKLKRFGSLARRQIIVKDDQVNAQPFHRIIKGFCTINGHTFYSEGLSCKGSGPVKAQSTTSNGDTSSKPRVSDMAGMMRDYISRNPNVKLRQTHEEYYTPEANALNHEPQLEDDTTTWLAREMSPEAQATISYIDPQTQEAILTSEARSWHARIPLSILPGAQVGDVIVGGQDRLTNNRSGESIDSALLIDYILHNTDAPGYFKNLILPYIGGGTDTSVSKSLEEDEPRNSIASQAYSKAWQDYIPQSGKGKFVLQAHWRGLSEEETKLSHEDLLKTDHSVHCDLRLEVDGNTLWGFTIFEGRASDIRNTPQGARILSLPPTDSLQGAYKLQQPHAWLDITDSGPYVSQPTDVGATSKSWAKFFKLDSGTYDLSYAREHARELFMHGQKLKGRLLIQFAPMEGRRVWLINRPEDQTSFTASHELKEVLSEVRAKGQKYLVWADKPGDKPQVLNTSSDISKGQGYATILKADENKQIVCGVLLEPDTFDLQGDRLTADEIKRSGEEYLKSSRVIFERHQKPAAAELVKYWFVDHDQDVLGQKVKAGSWVVCVHVSDAKIWDKVKRKEYTGFSVGGRGVRIPAS